jgi:hypothetical protein
VVASTIESLFPTQLRKPIDSMKTPPKSSVKATI